MPEISEIVGSDDEYQDAVSDESAVNIANTNSPSADDKKSNAEIVDEIIKQLDDEDNVADSTASGSCTKKSDVDLPPEYISEEIDENELAENEKSLSPEELEANKEKANEMKLEANDLFKNSKTEEAIELYTDALKICPLKATKERAVLYGNRAAAKIKLGSKKTAVDDCTKAIELWPEYVRALLR